MDTMLHSSYDLYPCVLMYPMNKMALIQELTLRVKIITERLSRMMCLRITAMRPQRETKSSSTLSFFLVAELARPFPHLAIFWW